VGLLEEEEWATAGPTYVLSLQPATWQARAACAELPVNTFFPERGGSAKRAKAVCARCEVRDECLSFALTEPELAEFGVWGGTTPRERRGLSRRRRHVA
jgi:WhiB family redox-sensing transcriptional regulator